jgi:hypothetical protein
MSYAATYPLIAERASVFPESPGFIGPKAAVPEFRWVPPASFSTTYPVSMSPSGLFPQGPAYTSPPEAGCPTCLRGLGESDAETELRNKLMVVVGGTAVLLLLALVVTDQGARPRRR